MTMRTRRSVVRGGLLGMGGLVVRGGWAAPVSEFRERVRALEARAGGRLGVLVVDTGSGRSAGYKEDERFAMCSTFKALLAATVLARVDRAEERLDRAVAIPASGLVDYSPITSAHAGGTLTVEELCVASVTRSDNEASNLLLGTVGGPAGVTAFVRGLGDTVTRLDRTEPTLNEARPGDPRDTTSPVAVLATWKKLVLGDALRAESREKLTGWLVGCQTGGERLRKGLGARAGWRIGDKTGSSKETCNDIAVIWPAGRAPVLVAAFLTESPGSDAKQNGVIAEVGRIVGEWIG